MSDKTTQRNRSRGVRRTAIVMALIALAFYAGVFFTHL